MIKTYYLLTKPGIILGNLVTTAAGFALASKGHFDLMLFLPMLAGLGFVIASACVFNNYIDREADEKMKRTKDRALVKKTISGKKALLFAIFLVITGTLILAAFTNLLSVAVALTGFFVYVVLYSIYKYHTMYGTLIGSISGGLPPVVGYCSVSDHFDLGAVLLFLIIVLWQMPHFYAIAISHYDEYLAASIPVLPVASGLFITKVHMVLYIIAFIASSVVLTTFGFTGGTYQIVAAALGCAWLGLCIVGFTSENNTRWARQMFALSLVVVMALCVMMSVDVIT